MRLRLVWGGLGLVVVLDVAWLVGVALGGGRPQANAHPAVRHGGPDWY